MFKEQTFDAGAVTLNYVEGPPSGPPLVLLHGLSERWEVFLPVLPVLSLKWQIYAIDLRGHGKSGRTPEEYRQSRYTADVLAFVRAKLTEPAAFWGYCLGGMVACEIAAHHPELVRAIVVGDMAVTWDRIEQNVASAANTQLYRAFQRIAAAGSSLEQVCQALEEIEVPVPGHTETARYGDVPGVDAAFLQVKAAALRQIDPATLELHASGQEREFLRGFDPPVLLQRLACPVLLLQSDPARGGFMTSADVELAKELVPRLTHARFDRVGLWYGLERGRIEPAVFQTVLNFLEAI